MKAEFEIVGSQAMFTIAGMDDPEYDQDDNLQRAVLQIAVDRTGRGVRLDGVINKKNGIVEFVVTLGRLTFGIHYIGADGLHRMALKGAGGDLVWYVGAVAKSAPAGLQPAPDRGELAMDTIKVSEWCKWVGMAQKVDHLNMNHGTRGTHYWEGL